MDVLASDIFTSELAHAPLPSAEVVAGEPSTGTQAWGELGDLEVGVWEMSAGVATDVEVDEMFIVLSGAGVVECGSQRIELKPGMVVRLHAGERTIWTITELLRKIYVA